MRRKARREDLPPVRVEPEPVVTVGVVAAVAAVYGVDIDQDSIVAAIVALAGAAGVLGGIGAARSGGGE